MKGCFVKEVSQNYWCGSAFKTRKGAEASHLGVWTPTPSPPQSDPPCNWIWADACSRLSVHKAEDVPVLVTFLMWPKSWQKCLKNRRVPFGSQIEGTVSPGGDCDGKSGICSQERERESCLLFGLCRTPSGIMRLTLQMNLSASMTKM